MDTFAASISVVIVSDYAAGQHGEWADLRKPLAALAAQDFQEAAEFILCETEELRDRLPTDLNGILPDLKIMFARGNSSYELKNAAVEAASADLIAMLDADCVPRPDWLRRLLDSLRKHPEAAAVSGRRLMEGNRWGCASIHC